MSALPESHSSGNAILSSLWLPNRSGGTICWRRSSKSFQWNARFLPYLHHSTCGVRWMFDIGLEDRFNIFSCTRIGTCFRRAGSCDGFCQFNRLADKEAVSDLRQLHAKLKFGNDLNVNFGEIRFLYPLSMVENGICGPGHVPPSLLRCLEVRSLRSCFVGLKGCSCRIDRAES